MLHFMNSANNHNKFSTNADFDQIQIQIDLEVSSDTSSLDFNLLNKSKKRIANKDYELRYLDSYNITDEPQDVLNPIDEFSVTEMFKYASLAKMIIAQAIRDLGSKTDIHDAKSWLFEDKDKKKNQFIALANQNKAIILKKISDGHFSLVVT